MDKPAKKNFFTRHKILTVILILVVLAIIGGIAGGGKPSSSTASSSDSKSTETTASGKKAETIAKIGESARDGKFEFTVNSAKCGETSVGTNEYLQAKAQGQFCRVNMSIKNIGNEAQSMFADNQKLVDSASKEYSYDSEATIYAAPSGGSTWYDQINPGNSVTGDILFDVPAGVTPVTAVLHDSAYSGGVKVSLQ